jgi:hypothetical protein
VRGTQNLPTVRSSRFDPERRHQSGQPLTGFRLINSATRSATDRPTFAPLAGTAPNSITLIDTDCHRYLWPMGPDSTWQRELAIAQVFYRYSGIEILTAVGR